MTQIDFIGGLPVVPLKDLPNMRASTAERKAELLLGLGAMINKAPRATSIDTVQKVREYKERRDAAAKVAGSTRSSIPQLEAAINSLRSYFA